MFENILSDLSTPSATKMYKKPLNKGFQLVADKNIQLFICYKTEIICYQFGVSATNQRYLLLN